MLTRTQTTLHSRRLGVQCGYFINFCHHHALAAKAYVAFGTMNDFAAVLAAARAGDAQAAQQVFGLMYGELHRLAHAKLRQHATMTLLDTTSLLHESFLRFLNSGQLQITDRAHFLAYSARVMRSVIVDYARARLADRRGGGETEFTLNTEIAEAATLKQDDIIRVHEALEELAHTDQRLAQVVEMRYFGGLTEKEIAECLELSDRTVKRDWEKARLLLFAALR